VSTVVVLRALGLGDTLTAVPALRALRRAVPEHRIVLAGPAAPGDLLLPDRIVDDVVDMAGLTGPIPVRDRPDIGVNLHGRGPQSHQLLLERRPQRLVGFASAVAGVTGPTWRSDEHERARWCRLVEATWGATANADDVGLTPPPGVSLHPGVVVLHPGAASMARRWSAARWAQVARVLGSEADVVITGDGAERKLATMIARDAGLAASSVLAGESSIATLARVVADAALVVCGDTGVAHLASAYATPSVVLFGPTPPAEWGPPPGPHTVLWHPNPQLCGQRGDPHADRPDPSLLAIGVDEVVDAARGRLAERAGLSTTTAG
jgi:ADP-heptose:LPS heptosyltransferase